MTIFLKGQCYNEIGDITLGGSSKLRFSKHIIQSPMH